MQDFVHQQYGLKIWNHKGTQGQTLKWDIRNVGASIITNIFWGFLIIAVV